MIDADMQRFYGQGRERERLMRGAGALEFARTQELLQRFLPPVPAEILDVGGGPGVYAAWLARAGYRVHLIDPVPLHITQAQEAAAAQPASPFTAALGDARKLDAPDASCDAVLCLGPLYHLSERAERLAALAEARRVLRPGGVAFLGAISRFGSLLDAVRQGYLVDPEALAVIETTVRHGRNVNPGLDRYPGWFPTAHFHLPDELAEEIVESGLALDGIVGVEGPGGFIGEGAGDPDKQAQLLRVARLVESEPSLLGLSPHLLAVARKLP
jgi:ubiquinone/menaquinone biosynthesis C-methylase UbiE